ncbi:HEPN domain-containing protein [Pseudobacillus sp. 179-B 2D1 NHS]|uniref:HEPN domain-containing protein n=1 Tax=Pseudobacillus sp. 179-B 2D1 NHS TaxID=3374292 RepID=UPI00387A24A5
MLKANSLKNIKDKFLIEQINSESMMYRIANRFDLDDDDYEEIEKYVEDYIRDNLFHIVINTLEDISDTTYYLSGDIETDDWDYKHSNKVHIFWNTFVKGYSRIINVTLEDYGMASDFDPITVTDDGYIEIDESYEEDFFLIRGIPGDYSFELKLSSLNNLNGHVLFRGTFTGPGNRILEASNNAMIYVIHVTGIKHETNTPNWLEYLIDGFLNLESKNNKMAFFNLFAALDNLINTQHEYIFEEYLELCKKIKISDQLKDKIRLFSSKEKKLQNKLNHVLDEFKIVNYKELKCYKFYTKLVKVRDKIAHGGNFEETIDIDEAAYSITTLIYILLLQEDVEKTNWNGIRS